MGRGDYETIVGVGYDRATNSLHVRFANGDDVAIPAGRLSPTHYGARWTEARVEEGLHIHVPVDAGQGDLGSDVTDVPWDAIRTLTDPEFAAEMARAAARNARRVGTAIRLLRQRRGLTAAELGRRAQMPQQNVSRVENGRHDVSFATVEKLLAAMGCTLKDLADAVAGDAPSSASA